MLIINSPNSKENKEIKIIPEMLNLLGVVKIILKNFYKKWIIKYLIKMKKLILNIIPLKNLKKNPIKKVSNENPFKILKNLNLG